MKSWPTFFSDMLSLIAPLPQSTGKSNMKMVDLFLRILMSIDEEVVNTLISRASSKEENTLNINIKDRMREQDVPRLANVWYELLTEYKDRSLDFAEMLLRIVGVYVGMSMHGRNATHARMSFFLGTSDTNMYTFLTCIVIVAM